MSSYQSDPVVRQPRADARKNRDAIVNAARSVLLENSDTTMQAIARAAGVGQGTLYRHFATREALLMEVYRASFDALMQAASRYAASEPGDRALRHWLGDLATFGREKHTLARILDAASRAELHDEQYAPIHAAIDLLLESGRENGTIRSDVSGEDVLPLVGFLWHLEHDSGERIARLLDFVVDGLRVARGGDVSTGAAARS